MKGCSFDTDKSLADTAHNHHAQGARRRWVVVGGQGPHRHNHLFPKAQAMSTNVGRVNSSPFFLCFQDRSAHLSVSIDNCNTCTAPHTLLCNRGSDWLHNTLSLHALTPLGQLSCATRPRPQPKEQPSSASSPFPSFGSSFLFPPPFLPFSTTACYFIPPPPPPPPCPNFVQRIKGASLQLQRRHVLFRNGKYIVHCACTRPFFFDLSQRAIVIL